jgi:octaprenyl-diphosphate synthase
MADEGEFGKNLGKDLEEGKITLPLINLLKEASDREKDEIRLIISDGFKTHRLKKILRLFKKYNSIEVSLKRARDLVAEAKNELSLFPDSPVKEALFTVADYTLARRK